MRECERLKQKVAELESSLTKTRKDADTQQKMMQGQITSLTREIESLKEQISSLTANAGDQVNSLHAEIERLKQAHADETA